jgi:hypothetical protein
MLPAGFLPHHFILSSPPGRFSHWSGGLLTVAKYGIVRVYLVLNGSSVGEVVNQ